MKIVQINTCNYGSTGKIMFGIHDKLQKKGYSSYVVWGRGRNSNDDFEFCMYNKFGVFFHKVYSRLIGKQGFASKHATRNLIKELSNIRPDIIHIHNLHGNYINIEILFNYIKKNNIKVIWTLHDCWSFTGKCVHFAYVQCDKWQTGCYNCPLLNTYPVSYLDNSKWNYKKKKSLFTGLNITLVTPSQWLATLVKKSFLKEYEIKVINNGIDLNVFKPQETNFRLKYNIVDKLLILGVASSWGKSKGLNDFIRLSKLLDKDKYLIVLVGVNQKQINILPDNIISISRTENQKELAEIYNAADIFFNPTYEDTYPTVNLEAIACNTPVITYDTGGSPEFIHYLKKNKINYIIEKAKVKDDILIVKKYIDNVVKNKDLFKVINRELLSENTMVENYIKLYKNN